MGTNKRVPWRPSAMPRMRRLLVEAHHAASDAYAVLDHATLARHGLTTGDRDWMVDHLARSGSLIHHASLWWVTADMASVAGQAAATLPEWTPSLAAPDAHGLLVWADPIGTAPWRDTGDEPVDVAVVGVMWRHDRGELRIDLLARSKPIADRLAASWRRSPLMPVVSLALPDLVDDSVAQREGGDLAQMLGSTWLMMRQRIATLDHVTGHPGGQAPQRGQAQRGPEDVQLVELRRPEPRESDAVEPRRVDWSHQWIVSGHWCQQPVGPGRALREPRWIAPYVKGPADKPLAEKERVRVWRR